MHKIMKIVFSSANKLKKAISKSPVIKRTTSAIIALTVAISPLTPALVIMADEIQEPQETITETIVDPSETEVTEAVLPSETTVTNSSESATEPVFMEDEDLIVVDPTETIDTTAPPSEQEKETVVSETTVETTAETTPVVEEKKSNVISANENNFADLIADLPSDNRLIVYYKDSLNTNATGVYYDGVYYLNYSSEDAMFDELCTFDANGIPFAIDGNAQVCGGLISYQAGVINPDATTKIAVIDTGSNLANEKYSVIGDDLKDYNGHGTAMVNNILAQTDDAYVISIKTMADDGTGNVSDICAAVQLATDLKVDIIFMALSFKDSGDYVAFKKLVNEAQDQNITVIASAGNNSADAAKYLPAGISGVITVGAILSDDSNKSPVSNYGSAVDYYVVANYTSDAASIFAGKYIAENIDDVATSCIMQGRPNEIGEDAPVVNAKRTLDRYNDTKGAYIYITAQQQRNMGYTCSDAFRDDIINAAKYLSGVDYGTYANNHGTEYEQAFLCLDYVHMVYGMIVIPTGHDNPGVAGEGDFERHGRQSTTAAPRISNGHAWWWAWFSLNTDNDVGGKKYIGSPYYLYPYVQGTSVPYWTTNVVRPVDNISQNNCYDCSVSCSSNNDIRSLNLEKGDLVFFGPVASGDNAGGFGHAAIYSGTNGYFYDCGSTTSGNHYRGDGAIVNGPGNYSRMMVYKIEDFNDDNNYISITKTSENTSITNGNSCYSLDGTAYALYASQTDANNDSNRLITFTLNANGNTSTTFKVKSNSTYYLKEISAGKGYTIDSRVFTVTVDGTGVVEVDRGINTTLSNDVYYIHLSDTPMRDDLRYTINKTLPDGTINSNDSGAYNGAKFRLEYYAKEVKDLNSLTYADADVVFEFEINSRTTVINRPFLAGLTPVKGVNLFTSFSGNSMPLGTYRLQEIDAPDGFACAPDYWILTIYDDPNNVNQIIRTRTKITADGKNTAVSNIVIGNTASEAYININEPVVMGRFHLKKEMQETAIVSDVTRYTFKLYANSGTNGTEELIATGTTDRDGNVLWTYAGKGLSLTGNDNNTPLSQRILESGQPAGKTHNIILPIWKTNSEKFTYTVYEYRPDTKYGTIDIKYTASVPTDWTKVSDNEFKISFSLDGNADAASKQYATADNAAPLTSKVVVNHEEYTGITVKKVVPAENPFDMTKVTFKFYNTDNGKDTLIANGIVDSKGNVTWYKVHDSGYGTTPSTSINVLNYLPLSHYRIEESWDKSYLDLNEQISVLVEEQNNIGWEKTETRTTYTYTYDIDLSDKTNDKAVLPLDVENMSLVQKFNLTKTVTVEGDASSINAELYLISDEHMLLISRGTCTTNGIGTYGFTWDFKGEHVTEGGIDTLILPVGKYRVIEHCPETYYKDTQIPYTYMTPEDFTSREVDGKLQFYKDFELKAGSYKTLKTNITNVRIEGSFDIIKVERSDIEGGKNFTFEIYYRGNGTAVSDTAVLIDKVTIKTISGKGSATISNLPEGWYEIREVGTGSEWISHWANTNSVVNGNKIVQLTSKERTIAAPEVNDNIKKNGKPINAVVCYNDVKPEIKTTLVDRGTDAHITTYTENTELNDTISYKNVMPGHYVMSGILQDKTSAQAFLDENGEEIIGITEFDVPVILDEYGQPVPQSGKIEVIFKIDTTKIEGTILVAFEELHEDTITGELIVEHKDINDVDQTVVVPSIKTTALDSDNGTHALTYKERVNIKDRVEYTGLVVGKTYIATGILMNAETGEIYKDIEGKIYTASTEFEAKTKDGFVYVEFKDVLIPYDKTTIVVFEGIEDKEKGVKVAVHADLTDKDQTVERPTAKTTATVNSSKVVWLGSTEICSITITDTISYTGLSSTLYKAEATAFKADGTQLMVNGQPLKNIVEFTPTAADGTVDVKITFSTEGLSEGDRIVIFEKIYDVATEKEIEEGTQAEDILIARHEDLSDKDQTITIHFRPSTGEIVPTYNLIGAALIVLSSLIIPLLYRRKKHLSPTT